MDENLECDHFSTQCSGEVLFCCAAFYAILRLILNFDSVDEILGYHPEMLFVMLDMPHCSVITSMICTYVRNSWMRLLLQGDHLKAFSPPLTALDMMYSPF